MNEAKTTKSKVRGHGVASSSAQDKSSRITGKQYIQILSTFIVFFNTWGLLLTFGAFQTYYQQVLISNESSSDIAWISTTCAFILLSAGTISGPLFDLGYYKLMTVAGSSIQVFGLMMLSLSSNYYQCFLSQGICIGIGAGMVFTPGVATASSQFLDPRTRAKVMGVVACGSSAGGVVYPLVYRSLISRVGFPWTVRAIGFIIFTLYSISFLNLFGNTQRSTTARRLYDVTALTDISWMCFLMTSILSALAYYVPFLYMPLLTEISVANATSNFVFDILSIINGVSIAGRLLAGFVAAKLGPAETSAVALFFGSAVLFCWTPVHSIPGAVSWAVFWGLFSGMSVALGGAVVPLFCPTLEVIGTRMGMYWVAIGIGMLLSGPIAGAVLGPKLSAADVWKLSVFDGCFMLGSVLFLIYPISVLRDRNRNGTRYIENTAGCDQDLCDVKSSRDRSE